MHAIKMSTHDLIIMHVAMQTEYSYNDEDLNFQTLDR